MLPGRRASSAGMELRVPSQLFFNEFSTWASPIWSELEFLAISWTSPAAFSIGLETVLWELPSVGFKLGVWGLSTEDLRFLGEDSCDFCGWDWDGFFFFLEALDMRISKAEGREVDIVLRLGFDFTKRKEGFKETETEGGKGSFPARLSESETRSERWLHDRRENINRREEREMAGKLYRFLLCGAKML